MVDLRISVYMSMPLLLLLACCSFLLLVRAGGRAAFSGPILEWNGMG